MFGIAAWWISMVAHLQRRLIEESDELSREDNNYLFSQELCTEKDRERYTGRNKIGKSGRKIPKNVQLLASNQKFQLAS